MQALLKTAAIGPPATYSGKVQQPALTAAVNPCHPHPLRPGARVIRPGPPLVGTKRRRARRVPDQVVCHGLSRSLADSPAHAQTWIYAGEANQRAVLIKTGPWFK